ncbi:hypothetical protein [Methylobacterium nodulans]|uniref:hypothetical protein n=1 Tax=Methylobacterium nodulans TaxID=114616 RepID=UPI000A0238A0|nr:hypothetical protein [Methylobacterium nodulans]
MSRDQSKRIISSSSHDDGPVYRAYLLGSDDRIIGVEDIVASDDIEALMRARSLADRNAVELWDRARRIIRVERRTH